MEKKRAKINFSTYIFFLLVCLVVVVEFVEPVIHAGINADSSCVKREGFVVDKEHYGITSTKITMQNGDTIYAGQLKSLTISVGDYINYAMC